MSPILRRVALVFLSLPTLMYAAGCLGSNADFVAMIPVGVQPPGVEFLVYALGLGLLASAILIHTRRLGHAAGLALAALMLLTAFGVHLPGAFVTFPSEMSPEFVELNQRVAISGVVKDLGLAGAGLLVARLAKLERG